MIRKGGARLTPRLTVPNDSLLHGMQGGLKLKIIETGRKIHQSYKRACPRAANIALMGVVVLAMTVLASLEKG